MSDILFYHDNYEFSYRVAGICIHNGRVLLQKPTNDTGFAFPGGHVAFGETNEETLIREFKEETGADISVGNLRWVWENFYPWGERSCQQICLYYDIRIEDDKTPGEGIFMGKEQSGGKFELEFHWVPLNKLKELEIYPVNAFELLKEPDTGVQHFVYRE